jgi:hypothetical protein
LVNITGASLKKFGFGKRFNFIEKKKAYDIRNHFLIKLLDACYIISMALNNYQLMGYNLVLNGFFDFQNIPTAIVNHNHNQVDCFEDDFAY